MSFIRIGAHCAALAAWALAPAQGETLPETLASAYRESNLLEASRALVRIQDESVARAVAGLRPAINLVATAEGRESSSSMGGPSGAGASLTGTMRLTLDLLLSDGGRQRLAVEAAKEGVLGARQTLAESEQSVILGAATAYYDVLRYSRLLELERNNLVLIETELDAARNRFQLGAITRTDVSAVEARLAAARSAVALRDGELAIARESYRLSVGKYPEALSAPTSRPALPASVDEAIAAANESHPSIKRARHASAAADLNLQQAETALNPRISLGGSVSLQRDLERWSGSGSNTGTISLTANMPLYRGGTNMSLLRQGLAAAQQARFDLLQTARATEQRVAAAWARLEISSASIGARREQVESAQLSYTGMREEAALGLRSTLDVLDAEQRLRAARTDLVAAETDRDLAAYALLAAMGMLTAESLGLDVEIYNPQANYDRVESAPVKDERRMLFERITSRAGR